MNIANLAKGMLAGKLGGNADAIGDVMDNLLGDGDKADLGSLVGELQSKGLGDVAASWLGEGENAGISADQLKDVLGGEQVSAAAARLGTDEGALLEQLKDVVPQIVDKSSRGGSLLDSLGGVGGLAKKFF